MPRCNAGPEPAEAVWFRTRWAGRGVKAPTLRFFPPLFLVLTCSGGLIGSLVPALPVLADQESQAETQPAASSAETAAAYTVKITGVDDSAIQSLLERSSQLIALADRPPPTQAGLVRRIEGDYERFKAVLRSEGYYDSTVNYEIDAQAKPQAVTVVIDKGPAYTLTTYDLTYVGENAEGKKAPEPPPLSRLGLQLGERARSADIIAAENRALAYLAETAHPLAQLIDRDAVVDHRDRSMRVHVQMDPGPFSRFGPLKLEGLNDVRESYIRTLVPWKEGEPYDQRKVNAFRQKLVEAGLFTTVIIDRPDHLADDGLLPMTVTVIEGKQRSVGLGAKYYTSEGPAGEVFWEHRNLFGANEDLRVSLEVGTIRQQLTMNFVKPDYKMPDQDFLGEVQVKRQQTDAFDEIGVSSSAKIRRPLSETWTGTIGTSLEWAQLHDEDGTSTSTLVGLPMQLVRDTTNDRLDPQRGMRLRVDATPYAGWYDQTTRFLVTTVAGSGYQPLDRERRFVLAGRAKVGSLIGESRGDVPPNKRFYAGGGDSIRGYPYQKVGPLDSDNDPMGGRSLLEVSAEFRARVWGNFALVPFVDGGNAYTDVFPDLSENLRWAAGLGARYHTAIGPVRLDVAFPLNRRDGDDFFQFYISLGQAF